MSDGAGRSVVQICNTVKTPSRRWVEISLNVKEYPNENIQSGTVPVCNLLAECLPETSPFLFMSGLKFMLAPLSLLMTNACVRSCRFNQKCRVFSQNTSLPFNKSAARFGYCFVAIIRPNPRI